ncbi:MAG: YjfB family protein [Candidatus Accumulibacter sp.]|jgi:hypothetical protein|nr:YjfB family protein [Accumulibacter sp.]
MDITSAVAAVSVNSATQLKNAVQISVLKKAIDSQAEGALALLQAVSVPPSATSATGGIVDTFA